MTCNHTLEWVIDDLVTGLSPDHRTALDEHLASCQSCAALARQYRQMWSDLPAAAVLRPPTHGWTALQAKIADEQRRGDGRTATQSRTVNWTTLLQRAAAVVLLVGVGLVAGMLIGGGGGRGGTTSSVEATPDTALPQFVLLFYEVAGDAALRARASNDIDNWARAQFRGGVVVTGAEMTGSAAWAGSSPGAIVSGPRVTHYIRIRATDLEDARRIASSAPVTAYGGVIEVRPVDQ